MAVKTEIMTQKVVNSSYDATQNAGKLAKIVANELKGTEWSVTPDGEDESISRRTIIITYTNSKISKDKIKIGKPGENGQVEYTITLYEKEAKLDVDTAAGFGEVNLAYRDDFGKIVEGTEENPISGTWRLFYADSNYAYLLRKSIGNSTLANLPGYNTSTMSNLGKNLNPQYTSWELKSDGKNLNDNIKAVAALLDPEQWVKYKDEVNGAIWAIGGVPLELFIASYNATHEIQITCKVLSASAAGYRVGKLGGETITYYGNDFTGLGSRNDINNEIYFAKSGGYWLSSPARFLNPERSHLVYSS